MTSTKSYSQFPRFIFWTCRQDPPHFCRLYQLAVSICPIHINQVTSSNYRIVASNIATFGLGGKRIS